MSMLWSAACWAEVSPRTTLQSLQSILSSLGLHYPVKTTDWPSLTLSHSISSISSSGSHISVRIVKISVQSSSVINHFTIMMQ